MEEIRFIESDENYLFLETLSGDKFKLSIDDALRAAVRHQRSPQVGDETLSPREIQDRIRGGATVSELAAETGANESLIAKFAAPVLDEIAHIVSSAQTVRLTVASDRPNVTEHVEFGQVIESRLRASGAVSPLWSAKKLEGNTWKVDVAFTLGDQSHLAAWLFELRKLSLAPENDMAIRLSTEESVTNGNATSLVAVEPVAKVASQNAFTQEQQTTRDEEQDEHSLAHQADIEEAMTVDLLDALRKKREARKEKPSEPSPSEQAGDLAEADDDAPGTQTAKVHDSEDGQIDTPADAGLKKGRASMPSWDQIVFGTKAED